MKKMVREAWAMFTEEEKTRLANLEDIQTEEDLLNLVEPDWEINEWKNAKELHRELKKELLPKLK